MIETERAGVDICMLILTLSEVEGERAREKEGESMEESDCTTTAGREREIVCKYNTETKR